MEVSLRMRTRSERYAYQTFLDGFFHLLDLDFGEAANLEQVLAVLCVYSLEHANQLPSIE
jgi:hypothetical protein